MKALPEPKTAQSIMYPREYYAKQLCLRLPKEVFRPVPRRLGWLCLHYLIIIGCIVYIVLGQTLILKILASALMGCSLGVLGYLGHEIIHGTVVRRRWMISLFGSICMFPWGLHTRAWIAWHNRVHHRHTQHGYYDPDTFGWVDLYKRSRWYQYLEKWTPGSGTLRSYLFLCYWFSFQSFATVFLRPDVMKNAAERRFCRIYMMSSLFLWAVAATLLTPYGLLLLMLLPLAMSNFMMMSYIATNHFLNPITEDFNDPLVNSLTVRSCRLIEFLHLNNNFHIEHHVLPGVNPTHAPRVANLLKQLWGDKYQEMSHWRAIKEVYRTPRFYFKEGVHINPRTRETRPTLLADYFDI
jgi:fatty acid desaturase